jgi:hypothetical protein
MDTNNLGRGAMIAGVSGVLLFIFMFFSWFGAPSEVKDAIQQSQQLGDQLGVNTAGLTDGVDTTANAWQSFDFIDLVLFLAVIVSVGLAVMTLAGASASLPVAGSALTCGIGGLALLLVLYRIIDPPGSASREIGVFLGLLATAGITFGGYLGMQEEGTSFAEQGDRLRG